MYAFPQCKRPRTFNITETGEAQPEPIFTRTEEENAIILGSAFEIGDESSSTSYSSGRIVGGEVKAVPHTSAEAQAVEAAKKAFGELAQLISVTSMLQKQQHIVISNCVRPPGLEPVGIALPAGQMIQMRREQLKKMNLGLQKSRGKMEEVVSKRQLSCVRMLELRKFWPLVVVVQGAGALVSAPVQSGRDTVAVDCTFSRAPQPPPKTFSSSSSAGQMLPAKPNETVSTIASALNRVQPSLVPLEFSDDGFPFISADELERPASSLFCTMVYAPTGRKLAVVSLWQSVCDKIVSLAAPGPGGPLDAIHKHCQRRQHESMCQLMFACLKTDASSLVNNSGRSSSSSSSGGGLECRWVVAPSLTVAAEPEALTDEDVRALLQGERFSETIDIANMNRVALVLLISENLQLVVNLQKPLPSTSLSLTNTPSLLNKGLARTMVAVQQQLAESICNFNGSGTGSAAGAAAGEVKCSSFLETFVKETLAVLAAK